MEKLGTITFNGKVLPLFRSMRTKGGTHECAACGAVIGGMGVREWCLYRNGKYYCFREPQCILDKVS